MLKMLYIDPTAKTPAIKRPPMSKNLVTVGTKNTILTGRNLRQNQAAICCDQLGVRRVRQGKRQKTHKDL